MSSLGSPANNDAAARYKRGSLIILRTLIAQRITPESLDQKLPAADLRQLVRRLWTLLFPRQATTGANAAALEQLVKALLVWSAAQNLLSIPQGHHSDAAAPPRGWRWRDEVTAADTPRQLWEVLVTLTTKRDHGGVLDAGADNVLRAQRIVWADDGGDDDGRGGGVLTMQADATALQTFFSPGPSRRGQKKRKQKDRCRHGGASRAAQVPAPPPGGLGSGRARERQRRHLERDGLQQQQQQQQRRRRVDRRTSK